jgi:CheY-like chemotaxis protein
VLSVAAHLNRCHAQVLTAPSAARAFDILGAQHVDVLLADIGMPEEDGYSFVRRVRASVMPGIASIPAAALTAFAREEDRHHAYEAGFDLHVPKPLDPQVLVAAVSKLSKRALL